MMMRAYRLLGILGAVVLMSALFAQPNWQKLRDAGSMSFDLFNFQYYLRADVFDGRGCVNDLASGAGTNQPNRTINFIPGTLDFDIPINQLLQEVDSSEVIRFTATVIDDNTVQWTANRVFNPPVCAFISAQGNTLPFKFYRVYGTLTMTISAVECQDDPLGQLNRQVNLRLDPAQGQTNELGFEGRVTDGACSAEFFGGCGLAYDLQYVAYGGARLEGDVDCNGCIDDADLLAVLFAFGSDQGGPEDVNGDGIVDDADLLTVLFNFGSGC